MSSFKVPRLKPKECIEYLSLESVKYQNEVYKVIANKFKRPSTSQSSMNIVKAWSINNSSSEDRYIKRRRAMRKECPMVSECTAFMYVKEVEQIYKIAESGKVCVGNIPNSNLATSEMGVSLCLYSDIYHQGNVNGSIPDSGFLLLVKYLKGRINYVQCDSLPMDPQPQFDCHMAKNTTIDTKSSCANAFQQSQIFIYDYTIDGENEIYLSKILPFAAVEFQWYGPYLFGTLEPVPQMYRPAVPIDGNCFSIRQPAHLERDKGKHESQFAVHRQHSSSAVPIVLSIDSFPDVQMTSHAYLYLSTLTDSLLRSDNDWVIRGAMEIGVFEQQFKYLQINWNNVACRASTGDLLDPLSRHLVISMNRHTRLCPEDIDGNTSFLEDTSRTPLYVSYTRIVVEDYRYSKRLCELFNLSRTIGCISQLFTQEMSILIFPDGKLSKSLGICSVPAEHYFHGLVLYAQHPQFIILKNIKERGKEQERYFSYLSLLEKQNSSTRPEHVVPLIYLDVLKQSAQSQAEVQNAFLFKLLRPHINNEPVIYRPLCLKMDCDGVYCFYHSVTTKIKPVDNNDKENERLMGHLSRNERDILCEKLFHYFKSSDHSDKSMEMETEVPLNESRCMTPPQRSLGECSIDDNTAMEDGDIIGEAAPILNHGVGNGSFYPLDFLTFCEAGYFAVDRFEMLHLNNCMNQDVFHTLRTFPENLWKDRRDRFKIYRHTRGLSVYK